MRKTTIGLASAGLLLVLGTACNGTVDAAPASGPDVATADTGPVDALPLKRGFYVRTDATCATASNATLALVRRDGITSCDFTRIERIDPSRYRVDQSCAVRGAPPGHEHERDTFTQDFEILSDASYRVTYDYGETVQFDFCTQDSLPEPWRDNDISDLIG